jgi:hypothetical protein
VAMHLGWLAGKRASKRHCGPLQVVTVPLPIKAGFLWLRAPTCRLPNTSSAGPSLRERQTLWLRGLCRVENVYAIVLLLLGAS